MNMIKRVLSLILALTFMVCIIASVELTAFASDKVEDVTSTERSTTNLTETIQDTEPTVVDTENGTLLSTKNATQNNETDVVVNERKVDKVKKLYKDTKYTDTIKFYWEEVKGAHGYRIYYKNIDKDKEYCFLAATTGTKVTVKNLPHTTPFEFKVAAFVIQNDTIYEGKAQVGKTATQPADTKKPTVKKSSSVVKISWNENSLADGYRIYRQDSKTKGKLKLYKTIKKNTTTSFVDKKVKNGKAYNYQVRAYREMYKGKTYVGNGTTVQAVAGLSAPSLVKSTSQLKRVSIEWNKNAQAQGYDIYIKADDSASYKLLKSTKNSYITTKKLRAGHTYSFNIKPYKLVGKKKTKVYGTPLTVNQKVTNKAFGKDIGDTYIEVSIKDQHMWYYIDGKLYVDTPVVTGNNGSNSTPTGAYKIWQRIRGTTLTGPTWSSYVDYWLAFTYSGCGIHDASWRSSSEFGGTTYMGNGSHGCVNTPTSAVSKIFEKAQIGTYVVVY